MEVRPGYKQTEVGVIPEEWEPVVTADLVNPNSPICYGVVQVGHDTDGGVPIVAIKHVKQIASAPLHRTSVGLERPYARSRIRAGDVLISIKGTIGRVGIVPEGFEGNISRELARLRPREGYCADFLAHQLEAKGTQSRISTAVVGTTRLEFSIATLRQFELAVPKSFAEQREIAAVLNDVDALLGGLDQLISKKCDLKQATMQRLLTGQTRLPGFGGNKSSFTQTDIGILPDDWEVERVGSLAAITTGSRNTQDRIEDGAYPFFVRSATVERINTYSYDGEAVLTAGDGVGTGKVFHYANGRFDIHQRVYMISNFNERLNGRFFFLVFSTRFFNRIMSMTAKSSVDSVRMEMIADMRIPLPSAEEQTAIAAVLSDMDAELAALETRRDKTRALKQAMVQELLTGRIRLLESGTKTCEQSTHPFDDRQANVHFRRSVLAAEIIDRLHMEPTFGHVKFEKVMFLVEHLCAVDTGSIYLRKAAGPYDNRALRSIDSQLRKQQWFDCRKEGERYRYMPMEHRGGHKRYFERYFADITDTFENVLQTFKTLETQRCEIVATLLSAWSDLLQTEGDVSDERIVHEVLNNWHKSKERIPKDRWLKALGWMRSQGFVPKKGA